MGSIQRAFDNIDFLINNINQILTPSSVSPDINKNISYSAILNSLSDYKIKKDIGYQKTGKKYENEELQVSPDKQQQVLKIYIDSIRAKKDKDEIYDIELLYFLTYYNSSKKYLIDNLLTEKEIELLDKLIKAPKYEDLVKKYNL
jgi:hypothetical protein